ncbi:MAG: hypothetical protein V3S01_08485 [Dehalococcoidia bacterium]
MPASWTAKDERQYGHILTSCRKRGHYGVRRCKTIAAATVNKGRAKRRGLGYWTPAFAGLGSLGGPLEKTLPGHLRRDFCLPGRTRSSSKYPVPDCSHANNALGRAKAALNRGYLSPAQYRKVARCARRAQRRLCKR